MGNYERKQEKISANTERIQEIINILQQYGDDVNFGETRKLLLLEEQKSLEDKNQRLQNKISKIDKRLSKKYDAANDSLKRLFGISLPDKDVNEIKQAQQKMVDDIKNSLSTLALQKPEWVKNFIDLMQYGTEYQGATNVLAGVFSFGMHQGEARQFREVHPDIANLLDAGFRVKGRCIQRYDENHTPYLDVSNVQILFNPARQIKKDLQHHDHGEDEIGAQTSSIDRQQMRASERAGRKEERAARQFEREQKKTERQQKKDAQNVSSQENND